MRGIWLEESKEHLWFGCKAEKDTRLDGSGLFCCNSSCVGVREKVVACSIDCLGKLHVCSE
jgi:hypothetical protein